MNAPCKGCPDRHEACHDKCEKYQTYHAERMQMSEDRRIEKEIGFSRGDSIYKQMRWAILRRKSEGK